MKEAEELVATAQETFEKGENVRIVGTLLSRQFTPKDGSKPRTVWEVVAREAYVIAPRRGSRRDEARSPSFPSSPDRVRRRRYR